MGVEIREGFIRDAGPVKVEAESEKGPREFVATIGDGREGENPGAGLVGNTENGKGVTTEHDYKPDEDPDEIVVSWSETGEGFTSKIGWPDDEAQAEAVKAAETAAATPNVVDEGTTADEAEAPKESKAKRAPANKARTKGEDK